MLNIKTKQTAETPPVTSKTINLRLNVKLHDRAAKFSDVTGLKITALLRNGLNELLTKNNY